MIMQRTNHGMYTTRFYGIRKGIKARCDGENRIGYKDYGGRGIRYLWKDFPEFKNDMYESYLKHVEVFGENETSLDRIDNNGNYCKGNCRRATWKEQGNNRSDNMVVSYGGKRYTLKQLSEYTNIPYHIIRNRYAKGYIGNDMFKPIGFLNRKLTYKGETHTLSEWSAITGINIQTIKKRVDRKRRSVEKILTTYPANK